MCATCCVRTKVGATRLTLILIRPIVPLITAYRPADVIPEIRQRVSTLDPDAMMQFTVFN
jgi:hypothetical protein